MSEGDVLHISNLHTILHTGWENYDSLRAEMVSLYAVCGVKKSISLHPTNS